MLYLDGENRLRLGRERAAQLAAEYRRAQRHHGGRAAAIRRVSFGGIVTLLFAVGVLALARSGAAANSVEASLPPAISAVSSTATPSVICPTSCAASPTIPFFCSRMRLWIVSGWL